MVHYCILAPLPRRSTYTTLPRAIRRRSERGDALFNLCWQNHRIRENKNLYPKRLLPTSRTAMDHKRERARDQKVRVDALHDLIAFKWQTDDLACGG